MEAPASRSSCWSKLLIASGVVVTSVSTNACSARRVEVEGSPGDASPSAVDAEVVSGIEASVHQTADADAVPLASTEDSGASTVPSTQSASDVEVVGRLLEWEGPRVLCGVMHVIGRMTYEVVRVIRGAATVGGRLHVAHSCPAGQGLAEGHHYRLVLSSRRDPGRPGLPAPDGSRRLWVVHAELAAPPGRLLGLTRAEVEIDHRPTSTEDGWVRYGEALAVRYDGDRAARVRARVPRGLSCALAARWMGFVPEAGSFGLRRGDGCEWPGLSLRHRLAPERAGALGGGVFEVWVTG